MAQERSRFRSLLTFHFQCLQGMYFSEYALRDEGALLFSERITDPYYNFFAPQQSSGIEAFDQVADEFTRRNRRPAVYMTPLAREGYSADTWTAWGTDAWMTGSTSSLDCDGPSIPGLRVSEIGTERREEYIAVFNAAYSGDDPDDPYGQLEAGYREGLSASFNHAVPGYKKYYVLGEVDDTPVAVASLFTQGDLAGVYGVGTIPDKRGAGIGAAIMARLARLARSDGTSRVFLQTEADSKVERWYESLGYTEIFRAKYLIPAST